MLIYNIMNSSDILISLTLGITIAILFRKLCTDGNCVIIRKSVLNKQNSNM